MNKVDQIKDDLAARWGALEVGDICLQIIDFLAQAPEQELKMLTYPTIARVINYHSVDSNLLFALNLLSASEFHILDFHAIFVDEFNEEHELNSSDVARVIRGEPIAHPDTGEIVENAEAQIIPFFAPSSEMMAARDLDA